MTITKHLTGQRPRCGATAERLAYHGRYTLRRGQTVRVIRHERRKGAFCGRYGMAFYDLKIPEEKSDGNMATQKATQTTYLNRCGLLSHYCCA
jgi:hypothetical protein